MTINNRGWDVNDIAAQLLQLSNAINNPQSNPGAAFELKKDLYLIRDLIDHAIKNSPNFGESEEKWLTNRDQKRILKILKSKN